MGAEAMSNTHARARARAAPAFMMLFFRARLTITAKPDGKCESMEELYICLVHMRLTARFLLKRES